MSVSSGGAEPGQEVLAQRLRELCALGHDELSRWGGHKLAVEVVHDGEKYAHETLVLVDDKHTGHLRVLVEVWHFHPNTRQWSERVARGSLLLGPDGGEISQWVD